MVGGGPERSVVVVGGGGVHVAVPPDARIGGEPTIRSPPYSLVAHALVSPRRPVLVMALHVDVSGFCVNIAREIGRVSARARHILPIGKLMRMRPIPRTVRRLWLHVARLNPL